MRRIQTETRWREAQEREALAWRRLGFARDEYLRRRGAFLDAWLRFWGAGGRRVLEIGGAGLPAVDQLRGFAERHALDPLMDEFERIFDAPPTDVENRKGRAEELPYEDAHFDAVVMLNVLDHVEDPARVLAEIRRVLVPDGRLFLSCDTYSRPWLLLRACRIALRGKRNNDLLHPHHYTVASLVRRVAAGFDLLEVGARYADPLTGSHRTQSPYPLGGVLNRVKRAARVYLAARPL